MSEDRFGNEQLARLLRLLPPAPETWVAIAKERLLGLLRSTAPAGTPLSEAHLTVLGRALESDPLFRERFDADPVAAADEAGMKDIAAALEHELCELVGFAERVASDGAYRSALATNPTAILAAAGIALDGAEPLLEALAVPEGARSTLPEVVAHEHPQVSIHARLAMLLFRSRGALDRIRLVARRTT